MPCSLATPSAEVPAKLSKSYVIPVSLKKLTGIT
jgi:hypothetical protein